MDLNDLTIITHTHTDCETLWGPYFDSYSEFFNHNKHVVLINELTDKIPHEQILYSDNTKYSNRLIDGLNKIHTEYVLISFEDMILYDKVKVDEINSIIKTMSLKPEYLFIRLIKSGVYSNIKFKNNLYIINDSDFKFSITPTIWHTSTLLSLLKDLKELSIWDLEVIGNIVFREKKIKGLYYYNNETPRGNHYDSSIYPHICSSIVKGCWNISEYSDVLLPILNKYNIDINEKGIF
jgi:hypothetical protein